jgi:hypothetical protein
VSELPTRETELSEFLRSVDVRAPDSLHREVRALIAGKAAHGGRRWRAPREQQTPDARGQRARPFATRRLAGAIVAAAAAGAIVAVLTGGATTPSLSQASALTLRPATLPAPAESATRRGQLTAAVQGVAFPYWERLGWRSTGARSDRVGGRVVTTVFYGDAHGRRIGYAIVAGTPAPGARGGVVTWRKGVPYRLLSEHGAPVVTWLREGRLCVVSGEGVNGATLLKLASWDAPGASA